MGYILVFDHLLKLHCLLKVCIPVRAALVSKARWNGSLSKQRYSINKSEIILKLEAFGGYIKLPVVKDRYYGPLLNHRCRN
jgi:hypothetical protein